MGWKIYNKKQFLKIKDIFLNHYEIFENKFKLNKIVELISAVLMQFLKLF